jgi:hypothetical protein
MCKKYTRQLLFLCYAVSTTGIKGWVIVTNKESSAMESPPQVIAAISYIFRPLVRLLLSHGISFQVCCDLVKSACVKVAEAEFKLDAKSQTDCRISLLTGIHRREVNRLRNERPSEIALPQHASMSALLLSIWSGHAEYLDEQGSPIPLARLQTREGSARSNHWCSLSARISVRALCWMNGFGRAS